MSYAFCRYVEYMSKKKIDAVIVSNYKVAARMMGRYFKDTVLFKVNIFVDFLNRLNY